MADYDSGWAAKLQAMMPQSIGGSSGGEGSFADDVANKIAGTLAKLIPFLPNFANPENAAIKNKEGLPGQMANGGAKSFSPTRETFAGKLLSKMSFAGTDSPVHSADKGAIAVSAPHIEPPSNHVAFSDLVGDSGGHGKYSVADVGGGPPNHGIGFGAGGSRELVG